METRHNTRSGFTLVELIVVLFLMGLMTAMVAVSFRDRLSAGRLDECLQRFASVDQMTRQMACRFDRPSEIAIDLDQGTLLVRDPDSQNSTFDLGRLPAGAKLDAVMVGGHRIDTGEVVIAVDRWGRSPSYAVRMRTRNVLGQQADGIWLLSAGLTGQVTRLDDEPAIELATSLAATGNDPH